MVGSIPSFTRSGRPPGELLLEHALRQHVDRVARQAPGLLAGAPGDPGRVAHPGPGRGGSVIDPMLDCRLRLAGVRAAQHSDGGPRNKAPPARRRTSAPPPRTSPQAAPQEATLPLRPAGARRAGAVSMVFGMMAAVSQDLPAIYNFAQYKALEEQRGLRRLRRADRHADQRPEQDPAHLRADLPQRQERGGLDRGHALLRAQRRRLPGHRPRPGQGHPQPERRPGRLDDHRAVRQERARRPGQPHGLPEVPRGGARLPARAPLEQGQDPHRVPQHDLLRRGRLRDRGRGPHLLRQAHPGCGTPTEPCASVLEPWEAATLAGIIASPSAYDPKVYPENCARPAQPRARKDVRDRATSRRAVRGRAPAGPALARRHRSRPSSTRRRRTSPPGCASSWSNATAPPRPSSAA